MKSIQTIFLAAIILAAPGAMGAFFTVDTINDELDSPAGASLSLREALRDASGGDTINFDVSLAGAIITLGSGGTGSGRLVIDKSLTIDASALTGGLTINADSASRVIEITPGNTVLIDSLTLTGGIATGAFPDQLGGGIFNDRSSLTLNHTTISNNAADCGGGVYNAGTDSVATLTVENSTITGNSADDGGGIYNDGTNGQATLTLTDVTISDNMADAGAGIYNDGRFAGTAPLTLNEVTISGNTGVINGGGICNNGISAENVALTLENVTLHDNSATFGGGIFNNGSGGGVAPLTINNSTLTGNTAFNRGGGIYNTGDLGSANVALRNSIVAGNSAGTLGPDISRISSSITPTGVSLISDLTDSGLSAGATVLVGSPKLAGLGNYGGSTQTMPPLPGSPVIDAATLLASTPPTDQLGNPRPNGPSPDIGAVEAFPFSNAPGFVDIDSDGIDDRLEIGIFGDLATADATSDFDEDGTSDKDEIFDMSDPLDKDDYLRLLSLLPTINFDTTFEVAVVIKTFPGLNYALESSTTLTGFTLIGGTELTADDFTEEFIITLAPTDTFVRGTHLP